MNSNNIARVCYAVMNAYRTGLGEMSRVEWDKLKKAEQNNFTEAVSAQIESPKTPEEQHNEWLEHKIAEGWTYAEKEDVEEKQTPHLIPYEALPSEQKVKDLLFHAVIASCQHIPDDGKIETIEVPVDKVAVKYIGKRDVYIEGAYDSKIIFVKDEPVMVDADLARKLLKHPTVYQVVEGTPATAKEPIKTDTPDNDEKDDEDAVQDAKDAINAMRSKQSVIDYAQQNFQGMKLSDKSKLADLKRQVVGFIDQYGLI